MNTTGNQQPWGIPLALAVGVHLLVLLPATLAPQLGFWQRQRPPVDIQTVSLFSVADLAPAAPTAPSPPAPTPPAPVAVPTPPPPPDAVVIPQESPAKITIPEPAPSGEPRTIAPQAPAKVAARPDPPPAPLSTQPIRTRADDEQLRQLREYYQLEAEAREAQREAETARQRALDAVRENIVAQAAPPVQAERRDVPVPPPTNATEQAGQDFAQRGGDTTLDAATREYLVRLTQHIQSYWALPNLPTWDENLVAVMVITVRRDGTIRHTTFEKQSENVYFNQLVRKAVDDATPLPVFPPALRDSEMEIGLRFRPGEVF